MCKTGKEKKTTLKSAFKGVQSAGAGKKTLSWSKTIATKLLTYELGADFRKGQLYRREWSFEDALAVANSLSDDKFTEDQLKLAGKYKERNASLFRPSAPKVAQAKAVHALIVMPPVSMNPLVMRRARKKAEAEAASEASAGAKK